MGYAFEDVKHAINNLTKILGNGPSRALQQEYEAGLHPTLLAYNKIEVSKVDVPILTRYLVGAASWLHQPANYYNIFSVCRCVNIVQFLNTAIQRLSTIHTKGLDQRLDRLKKAQHRDAFDAIAFELITAAKYSEHDDVDEIEFIKESQISTPDFVARIGSFEMFVECKKIDRTQEYTMLIRNAVRDLINPVLASFKLRKKAVLLDVTFHDDPLLINPETFKECCDASLREQTPIINSEITVSASILPEYKNSELTLYPSPKFYWERYGYRIRSKWIGLVHQIYAQPVRPVDLPKELQKSMSTWIDEIGWDAAAKWNLSSETIQSKYRRFPFDGIFKGLQQIQNKGINSALHVWLESDYYTGHRQKTFLDFINRLQTQQKFHFGWLVFNEILFDVSPKGIFDLIENAHLIQGPASALPYPLVTSVFVPDSSIETDGEFGIGVDMPDID